MAVHQIKQGLDLPITGSPSEYVVDGARVSQVAVVAEDYPFMKPRMHVVVGDKVVRGQLLFEDRKAEGVKFTSPAEGEVVAVHRGERRVLQSVVIAVSEKDKQGQGDQVTVGNLRAISCDVRGLWTSTRCSLRRCHQQCSTSSKPLLYPSYNCQPSPLASSRSRCTRATCASSTIPAQCILSSTYLWI